MQISRSRISVSDRAPNSAGVGRGDTWPSANRPRTKKMTKMKKQLRKTERSGTEFPIFLSVNRLISSYYKEKQKHSMKKFTLSIALALIPLFCHAEVRLPDIIGSSMVFQQGQKLPI